MHCPINGDRQIAGRQTKPFLFTYPSQQNILSCLYHGGRNLNFARPVTHHTPTFRILLRQPDNSHDFLTENQVGSLNALLTDEDFNGGNLFGDIQEGAVTNDNLDLFLANYLFYNNKTGGAYSQGLENRRIKDLATLLGLPTPTEPSGNPDIVTTINFDAAHAVAAAYLFSTLVSQTSTIVSQVNTLGATAVTNLLGTTSGASKNGFLYSSINSAETALQAGGFYGVTASDISAASAASQDIWAYLAAQNNTDATTLQRLNGKFLSNAGNIVAFNAASPDTGMSAGSVIRLQSPSANGVATSGKGIFTLQNLLQVDQHHTMLFDLDTDQWIIKAALLDGSDAGKLQFVGQQVFGAYGVNPPPISQITSIASAWPWIQIGYTGYGNWGAIQIDTASNGSTSTSNIVQLPGWYDVQPGDTWASIGALRNEDPRILAATNGGAGAPAPGSYIELTGNFAPMVGRQNSDGTYPASFSGTFQGSDEVLNLAGVKLAILGGVPNLSTPGSFSNRGIVDIVDGNGNLVTAVATSSSYTVYSDGTPGSSSAYIAINGVSYIVNLDGSVTQYEAGDTLSGAMSQGTDSNGNVIVSDSSGTGTASFNNGSYTTWNLGAGTDSVALGVWSRCVVIQEIARQ